MHQDPIADMLTRIRNASQRKHKKVLIETISKTIISIAKILKDEGFILNYKIIEDNKKKKMIVYLKYKETIPVISGLKRISKPSLRVYAKNDELPRVLNGYGVAIVSTSKGIITDKIARKENVGGEVLAYIW